MNGIESVWGRKQLQQLEIIPIGEAIVEFEINPFHGLDNLHPILHCLAKCDHPNNQLSPLSLALYVFIPRNKGRGRGAPSQVLFIEIPSR